MADLNCAHAACDSPFRDEPTLRVSGCDRDRRNYKTAFGVARELYHLLSLIDLVGNSLRTRNPDHTCGQKHRCLMVQALDLGLLSGANAQEEPVVHVFVALPKAHGLRAHPMLGLRLPDSFQPHYGFRCGLVTKRPMRF